MSAERMARGKLEIVREMLEAFGRRDLEAVLALCDPEAQFEGSGIEVEQERGGVLTVRDGLVVGGQFFTSQAKALEAAGLS